MPSTEIAPVTYKKHIIPSLLKWTGSKRSQASQILNYMPAYQTYYEPFLGSGALLYLANKSGAVTGDVYKPLIDFWTLIKTDVDMVIDNYNNQWSQLQDNLPDYFYEVRERFNLNPNGLDLAFLTRTCVNGIIRFNSNGLFNNSFHLSRKGMTPKTYEKIIRAWNKKIQNVQFLNSDYTITLNTAGRNDFVYLDPPYAGSKNRYVENLDVNKLFKTLESLNNRGVKWALSFDGHRGDENLTYSVPQELYKRHLLIGSGNSAVNKVLNSSIAQVYESLYLSY